MTTKQTIAGYQVRNAKGRWTPEGDLGIGGAADLHSQALKVLQDDRTKQLTLSLPANGVPLPAFQILTALKNGLEAQGKSVEIVGSLAPFGGRIW